MEQQLWSQNGGGVQSQSYLAAGLNHQAMDLLSGVVDADGALLMELMEDFPPSSDVPDGDVDRLSHVIRSLEAEISVGGATATTTTAAGAASAVVVGAPPSEDDGACGMIVEDMLSDLGGDHELLGSFGCWATEASLLAGHDSEGWCVYVDGHGYEGDGVVLGYETGVVDHRYYCAEEGAGELMYSSPLWE